MNIASATKVLTVIFILSHCVQLPAAQPIEGRMINADLNFDGIDEEISLIKMNTPNDDPDTSAYRIKVTDAKNQLIWQSPADKPYGGGIHGGLFDPVAGDLDGDGKLELTFALSPTDVSPTFLNLFRWDQANKQFNTIAAGMLIEGRAGSGNFVWSTFADDGYRTTQNRDWADSASRPPDPSHEISATTWVQNIDEYLTTGTVSAKIWTTSPDICVGTAQLKANTTGYSFVRWLKKPQKLSDGTDEETAAAKEEFIVRYQCTLSGRDFRNSQGKQISTLGELLAQDRANYHKFGIQQAGDQNDSYFDTPQRRLLFSTMPIRNATNVTDAIKSVKPLTVTVYNDRIEVTVAE